METDQPDKIFAWVRSSGGNKVVGLFNFSGDAVTVSPSSSLADGTYSAFGDVGEIVFKQGEPMTLPAHGYLLLSAGGRQDRSD